jgi:hypothetical protein
MSAKDKTPKTQREAQQQKEARRANILYGTIGVVFVLLAVTVFVWKSNIIQKNADAAILYYSDQPVSVETESSAAADSSAAASGSAADSSAAASGSSSAAGSSAQEADKTEILRWKVPQVSYYFTNIYQNFVQQNASYLSYMGLDTSKDLRSQVYAGEDGMTWFDYLMGETLNQMSAIYALNQQAEKEGYAWNDAMQAQMDENQAAMDAAAAAADVNTRTYLKRVYGETMTQGVYDQEMKQVIMASDFSQSHNDSLTYDIADLEAAYMADKNAVDVVDYQSVRVSGSAPSFTNDEGETIDPTDEEKAAAMTKAQETADGIYADFRDGESLEDLANENSETATYSDNTAAVYSSGVLSDWLFDENRKEGDAAVLTDEANTCYYVVSFGSRYRQEYETVNVRHILIQPEAGTLAAEDEGYAAEQVT